MGLFRRKSMQERQQEAANTLDNIVEGRGFVGRMSKAFLGSEFTEQMKGITGSLHAAERYQGLVAAGSVPQVARVLAIADSGMTINDNPTVVLTLDVDGAQASIGTVVSRIEIPRAGDEVLVLRDPQTGELLYGGFAPRA